mmetsp:Transcript_50115/g.126321  ORF Transcript_50115/g.126321 Transcript_50115/m.126321 type:complete len:110 (+) Transcript_50115:111-440(+)
MQAMDYILEALGAACCMVPRRRTHCVIPGDKGEFGSHCSIDQAWTGKVGAFERTLTKWDKEWWSHRLQLLGPARREHLSVFAEHLATFECLGDDAYYYDEQNRLLDGGF